MEQYIQLLRENGEDGKGQDGTYGSEGEEGLGGGFDSHDGWKEDPMVKELIREKINQISRREKVWGSLPGDIQSMILSAHSHEITWQRHLKHYLGELISFMKQSTFKRPNKRFGYPYSGRKKKGIDRKLVAIDTSYSVSDSSLSIFLSEINHLAIVQPVDLILFDHKIQTKILPFNKKHVRFDFKGRGGTAFTPVFKLAEERRYRSLIILTDGQAECPPDPVFVKNVLWVIIGENNNIPR